ncbi:MAG: hypothetical protein KME12_04345 [Trichocoleus desertorum ATA4-8-CV12]|jgi:hypothetical protein|nr:hypothetical protein [Trichocoleus desertorum ATA4-8-CV12]
MANWQLRSSLLKSALIVGLATVMGVGGSISMALIGAQSAIAQETPAEETPAEETPAEEAPTEETPAEETPAEETPAEETPAEEAPTEETPAEETPAEETPAEETPVEETPTEETPAEEAPAEETPAEQTPAPAEQAYDQQVLPIVLVSTDGETVSTRAIPGYQTRFSRILGSGALLVNAEDQVTGYYFTTTGLEPSQTLPYHFHAAMTGANPTSCEGDKALLDSEVGGDVITDLAAIAPLQSSAGGVGRVGSPFSPVQLPTPVALQDIGYLNIHSTQGTPVGPGIVCANVRLDPAGFMRK